jgi:hypothetical protein
MIGNGIVKGEEVSLWQSGWSETQGTRSGDIIPLSAWTDNGCLYIEYPHSEYNLTISIFKMDNSSELIHGEYDKSSCSSICIPLSELEKGYYRLNISNNVGGIIVGIFAINN